MLFLQYKRFTYLQGILEGYQKTPAQGVKLTEAFSLSKINVWLIVSKSSYPERERKCKYGSAQGMMGSVN